MCWQFLEGGAETGFVKDRGIEVESGDPDSVLDKRIDFVLFCSILQVIERIPNPERRTIPVDEGDNQPVRRDSQSTRDSQSVRRDSPSRDTQPGRRDSQSTGHSALTGATATEAGQHISPFPAGPHDNLLRSPITSNRGLHFRFSIIVIRSLYGASPSLHERRFWHYDRKPSVIKKYGGSH